MPEETIKVERDGAIVRIRMNRPDKRNAQNPTLIKSINDALDFMGQGQSWEHHFLLHVAGKRSEEYDRFWTAMEAEGGGFKPGGLKVTLSKLGTRKRS